MRGSYVTEAAGEGGLCCLSVREDAAPHQTTRSTLLYYNAHEDDDSGELARLQPPRYFEPTPDAARLPDAYAVEAAIIAEDALGAAGVAPRVAR